MNTLPRTLWATIAILFSGVTAAWAQFPGPGGPGGGWPEMFDPREMIQRMDANQNGQIEPGEVSDRGRFFLERIAGDAGLDLKQPIPVAKLQEAMASRRGGFFGSRSSDDSGSRPPWPGPGGPGFPPGGSSGSSGGSTSSSSGSSSSAPSPAKKKEEPLVPGFGVDLNLPPVPGFGVPLDSALSKLTIEQRFDADAVRYARETMSRYDTNGDGVMDQQEWSSARWRSDPSESDLNKDGRLTLDELAQRAVNRASSSGSSSGYSSGGSSSYFSRYRGSSDSDNNNSTSSSGSSSSGSGSSSSSSSGGSSPTSSSSSGSSTTPISPREYARELLKTYDENKSGVLEKDEWSKMKSYYHSADTNGDGLISLDELSARAGSYSSSGGSSSSSGSSSSRTGARPATGVRFLTATERLPKGLPDWFAKSDTDGDGQVALAEFCTNWTDEQMDEFSRKDLNGDGLITPQEALSPEKTPAASTTASAAPSKPSGSSSFGSSGGTGRPSSFGSSGSSGGSSGRSSFFGRGSR